MENEQQSHDQAILKELSDIKASLAVNTNETANIKASIGEIKADMKEIKNDFVTRRELNEGLAAVREEMAPLKKLVYGAVALTLTAVVTAIVSLVVTRN